MKATDFFGGFFYPDKLVWIKSWYKHVFLGFYVCLCLVVFWLRLHWKPYDFIVHHLWIFFWMLALCTRGKLSSNVEFSFWVHCWGYLRILGHYSLCASLSLNVTLKSYICVSRSYCRCITFPILYWNGHGTWVQAFLLLNYWDGLDGTQNYWCVKTKVWSNLTHAL